MTQTEMIQILTGFIGSMGFAVLFNVRRIRLVAATAGGLLSWLLFANRTRKMTKKLNARTMPDYFEKRYSSKGMKILASSIGDARIFYYFFLIFIMIMI